MPMRTHKCQPEQNVSDYWVTLGQRAMRGKALLRVQQ